MTRTRIWLSTCVLLTTWAVTTSSVSQARSKRSGALKHTPRIHLLMDSPYQLWSQAGTRIHLVAFDQRLRPVPRADVLLEGKRLGRTDKNGTFIFPFRAPRGWRGGRVVVRKKIRGVVLEASLPFHAYRRTSSFAKKRIYLYTDRQLYRPRGKIRARVIVWTLKQRYRPAAGETATFTLRGPSGDASAHTVTLDAFGTGHAQIDLSELSTGRYTLSAEVGKQRAERSLKVAWFKRPALEVRHDFPGYLTKHTRRLVTQVVLSDVMGQSPRGGTMVVEASATGGVNAVRRFKLDGRGSYRVAFTRAELRRLTRKLEDNNSVYLNFDVRQKNGQSSTSDHELSFVDNPYAAVVELDREKYRVAQTAVALVKLTDRDENPVRRKRVRLEVTARRGRTRRIWRTTDNRGVASFRFRVPTVPAPKATDNEEVSDLQIKAFVQDVSGPITTASAEVSNKGSLRSLLGKAQVTAGGWVPITVTLRKGFRPLERVLHCDLTDYTGAIVSAFTLPLQRRGGRWVARGRFKAPSWGTMLLTMFTVGVRQRHHRYYRRHGQPLSTYVAGLLIEGQSLTVHPNQALRLTLRGLPRQARPSTRIRYNLEVRGADGKLRDAAVGAALVDSNILAQGDPLQKLPPGSIFYNTRLRVMATTGAKILTWPVVSRTWGCSRKDIALPPFEFQEGDGCGQVKLFGAGKAPNSGLVGGSGSGSLGIGGGGRAGSGGSSSFSQSVRRRFLPTSMWAPALRARKGRLTHRFRLPDRISRQTLLLVASDKQGGVGMLRRQVTILQPVAIRVDVPPKMVSGDELELVALLRNYTTRPLRLAFGVTAEGVTAVTTDRQVTVAPGTERAVRVRIKAARVGRGRLRLTARAGKHGDVVEHRLDVLPRGQPRVSMQRAHVHRGHGTRWTLQRHRTDAALRARLELDFPNVIPVFATLQKMLAHPSLGDESHASVLRTVAQVLRYKQRYGLSRKTDLQLVKVLIRGMKKLLGSQAPNGSFSYWRLQPPGSSHQPDPYQTAYVLETLLDLKEVGIDVPDNAMRRAAWYLLTHRHRDGLWDVRHLAFWEGRVATIRTGLSAQIFRAVARASGLKCRHRPNSRLVEVAKQMRTLAQHSRDPRTVGAALEGLHALYTRCLSYTVGVLDRRATRVKRFIRVRGKLSAAQRKLLLKAAGRLLRLKGHRHWEPSWFSAYGGTLEATATALVLLHRLAPRQFRGSVRGGVKYLLDRRGAWGEWHNERGTAATLRALLELGPTLRPERTRTVVTVKVNGKLTQRLVIDPKDPYGSAINLRRLRLTSRLPRPKNTIEVTYTGRHRIPLRLVVERWTQAPTTAPSPPRSRPRLRRPAMSARLLAPKRVHRGRPFFAVIELRPRKVSPKHRRRYGAVVLGLPTHVQLSSQDLKLLREQSGAYRVVLQGRRLVLQVPPVTTRRRITLRLTPTILGRSHFLAPRVTDLRIPPPPRSPRYIALDVR